MTHGVDILTAAFGLAVLAGGAVWVAYAAYSRWRGRTETGRVPAGGRR